VSVLNVTIPQGIDVLPHAEWAALTPRTRMRITLWRNAQEHRCNWCPTQTVLVSKWPKGDFQSLPDHAATIDHLYPTGDPRRSGERVAEEVVLSCYGCNQERAFEDAAIIDHMQESGVRALVSLPSEEEMRERRRQALRVAALAEVDEAADLIEGGAAFVALAPQPLWLRMLQRGRAGNLGLRTAVHGYAGPAQYLRVSPGSTTGKHLAAALEEVRWAAETLPFTGRRELAPRPLVVRREQHRLARELGLESGSIGEWVSRDRRLVVNRRRSGGG
jgi:hypothetical protein